jgi:chitosanase
MKKTVFCLLCVALLPACLVGCGGGSGTSVTTPATTPAVLVSVPVSESRQLEIEDRIVSTFENSTTVIQYASIVNLNDGRGLTAGRAGFTSGTGDMLEVVMEYTVRVPGNGLAKFLAALQQVNGTASVVGLDGFVAAWKVAANDAQFIAAQDSVNERLYRVPARQLAAQLGGVLPLTKLALYEAGIQHGYGTDYDAIHKIVERAALAAGGTPAKGIDEKKWLQAVLIERRADLLNPANKATAAGWAASVSRADAIQSLYNASNFNLDQAITITVYGDTFSI